MSTSSLPRLLTVALVGNPNTGKSTLFSALCGVRQRVGNYPGVTVEKKVGRMRHGGQDFSLIDLPGTYSLAPRSLDEMVAVDVLLGRRSDTPPPDVVLCILDASNLERNLYLASQVLDLRLPVVVALNMQDVAADRGLSIDDQLLSQRLGTAVIPIQAHRKLGLDALRQALAEAADKAPSVADPFPPEFRSEVDALRRAKFSGDDRQRLPDVLWQRLLLDTGGRLESLLRLDRDPLRDVALTAARERLAQAGFPLPASEAIARYDWIGKALDGVVGRGESRRRPASDVLDYVLTHRVWGVGALVLMMLVVFEAVFRWARPLMELVSTATEAAGAWTTARLPEGALSSLLTDGLIAGVGGVLIFLPQIMILFFFIGILEDCGYMARAAYLMDKLMVRVGLSGKSFIPLLSSFACAVPGIMAARVIENRRDRLTTILVAPLMSCSARLPVYTLLIAAFVPATTVLGWIGLQSLTMLSMYLVGMLAAAVVALLLKRTLLAGPTPPFVMELPPYKLPGWSMAKIVTLRMLERGWTFIRRAGTLVVAVSILVWAGLYYPRDREAVEGPFTARRALAEERWTAAPPASPEREAAATELADLDNLVRGAYHRQSYLGRLGKSIEPAVEPLGWDWRIGCAVLASFPAREVVVATLGVIYNLGDVDLDDERQFSSLATALQRATWDGTDRPVFNLPVALSLMVFFALCAQCASTLVAIKRETGGWRWPAFTFFYMTALAYVAAFATYQVSARLTGIL